MNVCLVINVDEDSTHSDGTVRFPGFVILVKEETMLVFVQIVLLILQSVLPSTYLVSLVYLIYPLSVMYHPLYPSLALQRWQRQDCMLIYITINIYTKGFGSRLIVTNKAHTLFSCFLHDQD